MISLTSIGEEALPRNTLSCCKEGERKDTLLPHWEIMKTYSRVDENKMYGNVKFRRIDYLIFQEKVFLQF